MADFIADHIEGLLEKIRRFRNALELIDHNGCTNFTHGRCWDMGRQRGAKYGADAWCDACVARDALEGEHD